MTKDIPKRTITSQLFPRHVRSKDVDEGNKSTKKRRLHAQTRWLIFADFEDAARLISSIVKRSVPAREYALTFARVPNHLFFSSLQQSIFSSKSASTVPFLIVTELFFGYSISCEKRESEGRRECLYLLAIRALLSVDHFH